MMTLPRSRAVKLAGAAGILLGSFSVSACRAPAPVDVDAASIGGVVMNDGRPEAGVWVIAETRDAASSPRTLRSSSGVPTENVSLRSPPTLILVS
jgi:hypothetical protein